jgi:uncharacterized membrane protein
MVRRRQAAQRQKYTTRNRQQRDFELHTEEGYIMVRSSTLTLILLALLTLGLTACGGGGGGGGGGTTTPTFTTTDLSNTPLFASGGDLQAATFNAAVAINTSNMVVGLSDGGSVKGVLWDATDTASVSAVVLAPLGDGSYSAAYGINDTNLVVGESENGLGGAFVAAYWETPTTPVALDAGTSSMSAAYGVNAGGNIVGEATISDVNTAVYWGDIEALIAPLAGIDGATNVYGAAYNINAGGLIVGEAENSAGDTVAVYWADARSSAEPLSALAGQTSSVAMGVNTAGVIVGEAVVNGVTHAVRWQNTGAAAEDLGPINFDSAAYAINDNGRVAGFAETTGNVDQAVIWQGTTRTPVIQTASSAIGVNNGGRVVGVRGSSAFVAVPN